MLLCLPATLTALLSLAAVVVATPADVDRLYGRSTGRKCGTYVSPDAIADRETTFASLLAEAGDKVNAVAANFTVPVNVHVIYATKNITGGYIP
jgi:hypothetical protein